MHQRHCNVLSHSAAVKHHEAGLWAECDLAPHPADEGTATEKDFAQVCGESLAKAQVGAWPPNSQLPALLPCRNGFW